MIDRGAGELLHYYLLRMGDDLDRAKEEMETNPHLASILTAEDEMLFNTMWSSYCELTKRLRDIANKG